MTVPSTVVDTDYGRLIAFASTGDAITLRTKDSQDGINLDAAEAITINRVDYRVTFTVFRRKSAEERYAEGGAYAWHDRPFIEHGEWVTTLRSSERYVTRVGTFENPTEAARRKLHAFAVEFVDAFARTPEGKALLYDGAIHDLAYRREKVLRELREVNERVMALDAELVSIETELRLLVASNSRVGEVVS